MLNIFSKKLLLLLFPIQVCFAQLVPIDETELSGMTGQAFINLDHSSSGGLDFTKVSLGLDVKTSLNSDLLDVGNYDNGSDIRIKDFALGNIEADGSITPFEIRDPFIELAFEQDGSKQNIVGVRLGFGGAKGALSGTIESLSGNINVEIRDTAAGLNDSGSLLGGLAAVLLANSPIETTAKLVDSNGNLDQTRASLVGIPNGDTFDIYASNSLERIALTFIDVLPQTSCAARTWIGSCKQLELEAQGCETLGINVCFDLKKYNTLDVGSNVVKDGNGKVTSSDYAQGLFLGFQTKAITWIDGITPTTTTKGAFLNVPNGGLQVNLAEAFKGTDRVRTRYVDPYFGGF